MFLLDSLLAAPGSAAFVLFKELARKAQEEWLDDDSIKLELQELYTLLEAGNISDRDFEARECRLLERLEQIARAKFQDKWGPSPEPLTIDAASLPAAAALPEPPVEPLIEPLIEPPPDAPAALPPAAPFAMPTVPMPVSSLTMPVPNNAAIPVPAVPAAASFAAPSPAPEVRHAPPPVRTAGASLSVFQVIESTMQSLALLKLRLSSITSVSKDEEGWRVTAELVERKGVPDTNDLLGMYEFRLDHDASVVKYERTRMRRRGDLNRS